MGRRKIEIQPIVHERNRSVTFLKRKNGLFKKAYELGVLCSVDVAVIIFEERPGHHLKLYQYCSSDIRDVVGRQLKHDGEVDTKGPNDFSGGGNSGKGGDDMGDGDDDDGEDEDEVVPRGKRSRNDSARSGLKLDNDMGDNYLPRSLSNMQHPLTLQSSTSSSSGLPTSTIRTSSGSSIGPPSSTSSTYGGNPNPLAPSRSGGGGSSRHPHHRANPSRSPPETHTPVSGAGGYGGGYHGHGHAPPSSFRPGGYGSGGSSNGPGSSAGGGGSGGGGGGAGFQGFYPNQTPPGGYVGLPDYPRGGGPPSGGGSRGGRAFGSTFGDGSGSGSGMYGGGGGGIHPRQRSGDAGDGGVFDFLDGGSRQAPNPNGGPGFGLDWPVGSGPGGGGGSGAPQPPPASSANPNSGGGGDWFELLSSAPNPNVQGRDTKLSWERGGGGGGIGGGGSNDRHSIPSSSSRSPSVMSVGGHSAHGQMGRGSMDMSIGMGGRTGSMDMAMGMGMAGVSRDGVGKLERRE